MPSKYLFILKPLQPYFFGKEKMSRLGARTDFQQDSVFYPQQTTLLGLCRQLILEQEGVIKGGVFDFKRSELAAEIVGNSSFTGNTQNYGRIKSISPLFLYSCIKHKALFPMALDAEAKNSISPLKGRISYHTDIIEDQLHIWENDKMYCRWKFPLEKDFFEESNIFDHTKALPGIDKKKTIDNEEDSSAYYRQKYAYIKPEYDIAFAFEITCEHAFDLGTFQVLMGGQRSAFTLEIQQKEFYNESTINMYNEDLNQSGLSRISLLSDAYIPFDFLMNSKKAVIKNNMFRNIQSRIKEVAGKRETTLHYNVNNKGEKENESARSWGDRYTLATRGSVFYFDEKYVKKAQELLNNDAFRTIGYNHFQFKSI